jgi:hypothetical protein
MYFMEKGYFYLVWFSRMYFCAGALTVVLLAMYFLEKGPFRKKTAGEKGGKYDVVFEGWTRLEQNLNNL